MGSLAYARWNRRPISDVHNLLTLLVFAYLEKDLPYFFTPQITEDFPGAL